jgi:hypothetical protein
VALVTPLVAGREVSAEFVWSDRRETFAVTWDADRPTKAFLPAISPPGGAGAVELERRPRCEAKRARAWEPWYGDVTRGCAESFADCDDQLQCAAGTRARLPTCAAGSVNAGSAGHCHALCDADHACVSGQCVDWQGGGVCL